MRRIGETINEWLDPAGLPESAWPWRLSRQWPEIVGDRMAGETLPGRLEQGVLTVHFRQKSWQNALAGSEGEIIGQIRQRFPAIPLEAIRFTCYPRRFSRPETVSPAPVPAAGREAERATGWQPASAAAIGNERLRQAFLSAVRAYYDNEPERGPKA